MVLRKKAMIYGLIALAGFSLVLLFVGLDNSVIIEALADDPGAVETIAEEEEKIVDPNADAPKQAQLENPPRVVKAIYATGWSAGSEGRVQYFIDLINSTELNAIVIDIKDYSGILSYEPEVAAVKQIGAFEKRVAKINALIQRLHEQNIYVIGRISIFQDPALAEARPELAVKSAASGELWRDYKKLSWMDSASQEVWDYNIAIARDALERGFDEVNFDYIRFPSDGPISDIAYPFFDTTGLKHEAIARFFAYARKELVGEKISADLFGEVSYARGDIGVGQVLEDAFGQFDAIAPMTYPSHYAKGFIGLVNPAEHPYEVVKYSIDGALSRIRDFDLKTQPSTDASGTLQAPQIQLAEYEVLPTIRPWLQDFDLGADYTADMVRAQIQAVEDSAAFYGEQYYSGWMIWSPSNVYTAGAFRAE